MSPGRKQNTAALGQSRASGIDVFGFGLLLLSSLGMVCTVAVVFRLGWLSGISCYASVTTAIAALILLSMPADRFEAPKRRGSR